MTLKMTIRMVSATVAVLLSCVALSATPTDHTDTDNVSKGIDMVKYDQMVQDVRDNPSHGRLEFRAAGESEEMVYHNRVSIGPFMAAGQELGQTRQYVLHLGLPVELQGEVEHPVDRIEPVELALAGLSDCVMGTIAICALTNGINIDHISSTVRAPLDVQVLLGIDGIDQRDQMYDKIVINVEIEGPDLTEEQRLFLSKQVKRSPMFNLVGLAHDMDTTVKIRAASSTAP